MLASHHDCGAPLFRCQGDIVCPVCTFEDQSGSAKRGPVSEAVPSREKRRPDPSRAQLQQMHEMPLRRGIKKDGSDRSEERTQPYGSEEISQPDRSEERAQPDGSEKRAQLDRSEEGGQPDGSEKRSQPDGSEEGGQPDRSRKGYPSIQDDVQFDSVKNDLRSALLLRLHELAASIRAEQDLDKLKQLLDCLEALLRVLKSLPE